MGGSRIAIRTCQYLPNNIRVKVIETNKEKSHRIAEVVPGNVLIINGDGRDTDLLMQEGIKDAQAFIALTDNSSTNILACLAAKTRRSIQDYRQDRKYRLHTFSGEHGHRLGYQ